jgi:hypothetical protein
MKTTSPNRKAAKAVKPTTKPQPTLMPLPASASSRKRTYGGGHSIIKSFKTDGTALSILMQSGSFHTEGEAINFALRSVVANYGL